MATRHLLTERGNPARLSIVIPAYNEATIIPILRRRLEDFALTLPCPVEWIVVNDGSSDETLSLLIEWADTDPQLKVLSLARNFGHQAAVTAGLDAAAGEAVVILDADLQDPPEVIHEMLARYREGYDVVYGQRASRQGESLFKRLTAWGFYRFMRSFIHKDLPADAGDFRLVSRRCLDALKSMRETHRFIRGMVAWVGFAQTAVVYQRAPRAAGQTKYSLRKMLWFAWTAAVSFSPAPLRASLGLGMGIALGGIGFGLYVMLGRLLGWYTPAPGWASLIVFVSIIGGAVLISNGVLGEYIGRIFEESKSRPLYIVSQSINFETSSTPSRPIPARRSMEKRVRVLQ
jgi:dolichol-phosphate mannosyltransferase